MGRASAAPPRGLIAGNPLSSFCVSKLSLLHPPVPEDVLLPANPVLAPCPQASVHSHLTSVAGTRPAELWDGVAHGGERDSCCSRRLPPSQQPLLCVCAESQLEGADRAGRGWPRPGPVSGHPTLTGVAGAPSLVGTVWCQTTASALTVIFLKRWGPSRHRRSLIQHNRLFLGGSARGPAGRH